MPDNRPPQQIYPLIGVHTPFDPANTLVTSPVFAPLVLAAIRLLLALYTLVTLIVTLVWEVQDGFGSAYLSYFTHLSYTGLCAYFWASGVQGAVFALRGRKRRSFIGRESSGLGGSDSDRDSGHRYDPVQYPLQDWPRPLQALHVLLLTTVTAYPLVVTAVFWALLASPSALSSSRTAFTNISVHMLNTPLALFEVLLTNTPPAPWLLLPLSSFVLFLYVALAYLSHATVGGGYYPYKFLNPNTPAHPHIAGAYLFGMLFGYTLMFLAVRGLVLARVWAVRRLRSARYADIGEDKVSVSDSVTVTVGGKGGKGGKGEEIGEWEML